MTDELEQRLRSANPAPAAQQGQPVAPWIQDLVEATMNVTDERADERAGGRAGGRADGRTDGRPRRGARWLAVAACGAAAVALTGGLYASRLDPGSSAAQSPPVPAVQLALSVPDATQICAPFSVAALKDMPVVFSGTVVGVEGGNVRLKVDRWYRGGTSPEVLLKAPSEDDQALVGAVPFVQGQRYLVSATAGVVNSCGYTGVWSAQYEAAVRDAFKG